MDNSIEVRKGEFFVPVYVDSNYIWHDGMLANEVKQWLWDHNLEQDDRLLWTFYHWDDHVIFLFKDPNTAMLFKLTWA